MPRKSKKDKEEEENPDEKIVEEQEESKEEPKRKRGRPRKNALPDDDDAKTPKKAKTTTPKKSTPKKTTKKSKTEETTDEVQVEEAEESNKSPKVYKTKNYNYVKKGRKPPATWADIKLKENNSSVIFPSWGVNLDHWKILRYLLNYKSVGNKESEEEALEYCPKNRGNTTIAINSQEWEIEFLTGQNIEKNKKSIANIALNVGGPSWASDWAYTSSTVQYLAVGVYSDLNDTHVFGKKYSGKNMIQIWKCDLKTNECKFVLGIGHNGGGIKDIKWCPNTYDESINRLGVLGVSDLQGSVMIYAVPLPHYVSENKIVCEVTPLINLQYSSVLNKILWNFAEDSSFLWLLAGAENGAFLAWNFETSVEVNKINKNPVFSVNAHTSFITGISRSPTNSNIVATSSYDNLFKFWDIRNPYRPLYSHQIGGGYLTSIEWGKSGLSYFFPFLVLAMEDSSVRLFSIDAGTTKSLVEETSDEPSVSLSCKSAIVATASAQGSVEIYDVGKFKHTKKRTKETPTFAVSISEEENVYKFEEKEKATSKKGEKRTFSNPSHAALRVQFNPNETYGNWLFASTATGIILLKNFDK